MNRFATPVTAAAILLAAVPALAGFRSGVKSISAVATTPPETIRVYNDGNRYTHVTQSHVWFRAQTAVECKFHNDLMYSILAVGNVTTASGQLGSPQGPWAEVSTNGRESAFQAHLGELFAPPRKNPPELCNAELDKRVSNGESRVALLQHGFELLLAHDLTFLANCKYTGKGIGAELDSGGTGPGSAWPQGTAWDGWGSAGTKVYSTVRCEGQTGGSFTSRPARPKPATNDLAIPFQVQRAALTVTPKTTTTECPATLTANGSITVVGEGTVQYRVEHNGALGPVQQMHFGPGDPKGKALSFHFQVGTAPGGELGKTSGGGSGGQGAIGGLVDQAPPSDKVGGSLRLIIVAPKAGVDHSSPTGYTVTCRTPPPSGPTTLTGGSRPTHGGR